MFSFQILTHNGYLVARNGKPSDPLPAVHEPGENSNHLVLSEKSSRAFGVHGHFSENKCVDEYGSQ